MTFPFLLELFEDMEDGRLEKAELLAVLRMTEAYVFRRLVCDIPSNSHNKTFSTFSRALRKDRYLESVKAHFLTMPSYRRFPSDGEFRKAMESRDLYGFRNRSYWLRRLENHGRKERVRPHSCPFCVPLASATVDGSWRGAQVTNAVV